MFLSRKAILLLISPFPNMYDISLCFNENMVLESMVAQPQNKTLWFQRDDEEKNTCVTLSGDIHIVQDQES